MNFGHAWEHVRLLSDETRNEAMLQVMARRCPGARVVEVGCGTGLLSCIAAKMGAKKVYAVEPTSQVQAARQMVEENGLGHIVEVIEGMVQEVPVQEVDFAFSELLNADPFAEGVLEAMAGVRPWLAEGGFSSPTRLRVYAALIREGDSAREVRHARQQIRRFSQRFDLKLDHLDHQLAHPGAYTYVHHVRELASAPALIWDLSVGHSETPEDPVELRFIVREAGPVGGAVLWFEADLDEGVVMNNVAGDESHWGQLVSGWPKEYGLGTGDGITVLVNPTEDGVTIEPVRDE